MKAVYLEWDDSQTTQGWVEDRDLIEPTPNKSIGWLIKETDAWLWIATSISFDEPTLVDPLAIPKAAIRKMSHVKVPE